MESEEAVTDEQLLRYACVLRNELDAVLDDGLARSGRRHRVLVQRGLDAVRVEIRLARLTSAADLADRANPARHLPTLKQRVDVVADTWLEEHPERAAAMTKLIEGRTLEGALLWEGERIALVKGVAARLWTDAEAREDAAEIVSAAEHLGNQDGNQLG